MADSSPIDTVGACSPAVAGVTLPARQAISAAAVSAVIVNWNSGSHLRQALDALFAHLPGGDWDVTVVDNASSDGSDRCAADRGPRCRLVRNARNRGFGAAVNQAVARTAAPCVLIVNPDCRIESGAVAALVAALRADGGCGLAGPAVLGDDGVVQGSARGDPDMLTGLFGRSSRLRRLLPASAAARRNVRDAELAGADGGGACVDWVSGACMLVRRCAFEAVGGFDERYFLYWEDADLCRRLRGAGWRMRYVPSARVRHAGGVSTRSAAPAAARAFHESAFLYYATHVAPGRRRARRWLAWTLLRVRYCWTIARIALTGRSSGGG